MFSSWLILITYPCSYCFCVFISKSLRVCLIVFVRVYVGGAGVLVLNAGMADWLDQKRQINSLRRN